MLGNRRFLILFAISALLHALVLATSQKEPALPTPNGAEALRVTLLAPVRVPPAVTDTRQETRNAKQPASTPMGNAVASAQNADRDQAAVDIRGHQLEEALTVALRPHFYYPPLARQQGWEGEVRLALRVEANGSLTRVRIVRSSGYGILDHAALRSLGHVQHLPEAVALLNGRSHDVILPVQYQLTGIF
jgi:protein TonB